MSTDPLIGTELAGHRVEALIGRGGGGTVYLAEHVRLRRRVALKVLPKEMSEDGAFRERFIHEARAAAGLHHPNIVTVYDAGEVRGVLYLSMLLVEGFDLAQLLGGDHPVATEDALTILEQVAQALDTAHTQGFVHRDVKPANILIERSNDEDEATRAFLSDFGIAKPLRSVGGPTRTGEFVGTIDYVAPEQIRGQPVDGRADQYSLACVLCECLSGEVPYPRELDVAVIYAHLNDRPPTIHKRRPDLPREVDAVVARAMAKLAVDRFESCSEFVLTARRALRGTTREEIRESPAIDVRPTGPSPTSGATVGRGPELEAIDRFIELARTQPAALLLEGEAGIGKTTLWRDAARKAELDGFHVMSCRATEHEAALPYAALGDLFEGVDDDIVESLPAPQRTAMEVTLLRRDAEPSLKLEQRAIAVAVLNVLAELARRFPVILAIDDVQWLDPPTASVLRFALRRMEESRVGVLLSVRTPVVDPLGIPESPFGEQTARLPIFGLTFTQLDEVLRSRLHVALTGPTVRKVYTASAGNPFLGLEIGRALLKRGERVSAEQPLPVPETIHGLLRDRYQALPPDVRDAIEAASALARPTVELVEEATGRDASVWLPSAVEGGFIEASGERIKFTHPLLASVFYAELSAERRRELHKTLSAVVTDAEEQARHLALATTGPDPSVAASLDMAAARAAARGAPDTAAELLEQALLKTTPDDVGELNRRRVDAADQHFAGGDTGRARALLGSVIATAGHDISHARALHRLGNVLVMGADYQPALAHFRRALRSVGNDERLRVAIERDLSTCLMQVGDLRGANRHAEACLQVARTLDDPSAAFDGAAQLTMTSLLVGKRLRRDLVTEAEALEPQLDRISAEHPGSISTGLPIAIALKWADDFDAARLRFEKIVKSQSEHGDEGSLSPTLFQLGELECWAGRWSVARSYALEGSRVAKRTGQRAGEYLAMTLSGLVDAYLGDDEEARRTAEQALEMSRETADHRFKVRNLRTLGFLELSRGDADAAMKHLDAALELEAATNFANPAVLRLLPDAIEALIGVGDTERAESLTRRLVERGRKLDSPWARATGSRSHGLLQAETGHLPEAAATLQRALGEHDGLSQPFELGRTLLVAGGIDRRLRQKRSSRGHLERCLSIFQELGARRWAERARDELGRVGGRSPAGGELTEAEQQIIELVKAGYTNRQVAGALFLSPRTVENHLTRIYRKLGIRSRRDLGRD